MSEGLNGHADKDNGNARAANGSDYSSGVAGVDDGSSRVRSGARDAGNENRGVAHALVVETSNARNLLADMRDLLGDDADLIATTIEGETELTEVASKALGRILELNGMMDGIANMMASLKDRGERLQQQRDNLRTLLGVAMETGCIKKLETPLATASLRAVPPKAEIIDEAAIPARFWKPQEPKLDRKAVLDALKAKEPVPGATLSNGGMTVSIKAS